MTAYQFVQPWLSKTGGDEASTAYEFANLRKYLKGLDDGTISLFNPTLLNATINALTAGGNITMGGFKLTGLGAGSVNGDSLRYEQVIGLYLLLTGGTMSGAIAMGTNKITGLSAATANGDAIRFEQVSGQRILQVQSATSTTAFSTTSSTYQTSNLSVAITPASTASKIFVIACGNIQSANIGVTSPIPSIFRGATDLSTGGAGFAFTDLTNSGRVPCTVFFFDSPATASAVTYAVKLKNSDNTTTVKFGDQSTQVIVAFEVG